ncbi:MAG: Folylpolyglutamate synthase [Actinomycetota bacterium]|jgi:dihydrofolate synthase/folylpolyglutamate synthase
MTLPELQELARVVEVLESRWPETKIEPSLDRISHLMTLLGDPQFAYPVIHVTGTNGKTSTARMIESLLRALGLRTGLVTSPHLHQVSERIRLNGDPIPAAKFVEIYDELEPYLAIVDSESLANGGPAMSYFEVLTGMAFAAFADAPVDVAVVEVGMGGTWDATNVVSPLVSVVMPIGLDHAEYLGDTVELVATEKSGIIKTGSIAVLSYQDPIPAEILLKRAVLVDAAVARQGVEFSVRDRALAIGGQALNLDGLNGSYEEILLPLFGAHQAANASVALAAVEAFFGGTVTLDIDAVREGLGSVTSPGRMEIVRRSPTVIVDAAHNPHGATSLATALEESFTFEQIIGVVSVMADKDVAGLLQALEPMFNEVVVTWNGAVRAMPATDLAQIANQIFGEDRVHEEANLASAIDKAIAIADEAGMNGVGVVVTGSVVTAAAGRALMGRVGT